MRSLQTSKSGLGTLPAQIVFKLTSKCNIACTYCYQDTLEDGKWRAQFSQMSPELFQSCLEQYLESSSHQHYAINLQGGEPLLLKKHVLASMLDTVRECERRYQVNIDVAIQSNGMLVDDDWCELFLAHDVSLGISLDGPPEIHDRRRLDKRGRGTSTRVESGLRLAIERGVTVGVICVADADANGRSTYEYYHSLGIPILHVLLPAQNHATGLLQRDRRRFAPFLIDLFDAWLETSGGTNIPDFEEVIAGLSGMRYRSWILNAAPASWTCFLPDGSVETGDPYGICEFRATKLDTVRASLEHAMSSASFAAHLSPPAVDDPKCQSCPVFQACGGGFPSFRYGRNTGFTKRTVYCEDTAEFYGHILGRLEARRAS